MARWARPGEDGQTPAGRVHTTCQRLADLAADAERKPRRPVPVLAAHGLADQVSVLARDALDADPALARVVASELVALRRAL